MPRGRPRQFETDKALQGAMLVFWRRGYRGTSLDDLTEALQINRPSLYAAFGDKENLFLQVIDYYRDHKIKPAIAKLVEAEDLRDGLQSFFRAFVNLVAENEQTAGCLIGCLLSEECCESGAIKTKLAGLIEAADRFYTNVFREHEGELDKKVTPESAAKLLSCAMNGLSIRARAGSSKKALLAICDAFVNSILK